MGGESEGSLSVLVRQGGGYGYLWLMHGSPCPDHARFPPLCLFVSLSLCLPLCLCLALSLSLSPPLSLSLPLYLSLMRECKGRRTPTPTFAFPRGFEACFVASAWRPHRYT